MFCASVLIFDGNKGMGSRFHVLRFRTHFRLYRGRLVTFSCFACPDSFSAIPKASGLVFMFCALRLVLGGVKCVGSRFHILPAMTRFRRGQGRRAPFSYFARPDSFSAVPSASGPVFMFCAPGLVLGCAECIGSRFHILPAQTRIRRYRGRRVPFS
jgi:hypothetical protein